jgi:hypothetical protein
MPRVIMNVNVVRQCRANVSSRKTSDELLSMCASIFAVAMKTFSAFCGRKIGLEPVLAVYVPQPHTAERILVGQARRLRRAPEDRLPSLSWQTDILP